MGLDQYLYAKMYLSQYDKNKEETRKKINALFPEMQQEGFDLKEVVFEVGYWRKANHIHKWFVDNVQGGMDDCGNYSVGREQLEILMILCKKVLANKTKANELLPTMDGCFFGDTDYDEYYFECCQDTIEIIDKVLKLNDIYWLEYQSSW